MTALRTKEDFKAFVTHVESKEGYERPQAFGVGLATINAVGETLEVFFPVPNFEANYGSAAVFASVLGHTAGTKSYSPTVEQLNEMCELFTPFHGESGHKNIDIVERLRNSLREGLPRNKRIVVSFVSNGSDPSDVEDAYLRLHLLSHRLVRPHVVSVKGIFKVLPNVAWTDEGCIALAELAERQLERRLKGGMLLVHSVDKFPRMTDYVVPSAVRLCDAIRVRLGAYIGEGATFMHEGFCNFNAGVEGPNMIEGRVSSGVFVGKGTDIGGGCSTMGTLSGGGTEVISIGAGCLLGANSGTGISLGDGCTIEAGLYVTAGSKVELVGRNETVKARELSGAPDLLYRRNSTSGAIEAISKKQTIGLNEELHTKQ